jgi:hypothetical protein
VIAVRGLRSLVVLVFLAAMLAAPSASAAAAACRPFVHRVASDDVGDLYENFLHGADVAGPDDVWAVGFFIGDGGVHLTLAKHWDGAAWTAMQPPNPSPEFNVLLDVAAAGPDDVWAVGQRLEEDFVTSHPLIEHWDGSSWSVARAPDVPGGSLAGVAAVAPDDVWAVGQVGEDDLTMHWNGTVWSVVPAPEIGSRPNSLTAVAGSARDDVWAVGFHFVSPTSSGTSVLHWNGAAWSVVPSPNGSGSSSGLFDVAVDPSGKAWAVGDTGDGETGKPLILRFDGSVWKRRAAATSGDPSATLRDVAVGAQKDVWAVGSRFTGAKTGTLVEHWDGRRWKRVTSVSPSSDTSELGGVAVEAGGPVWMVGDQRDLNINAYRTVAERICPIEVLDGAVAPKVAVGGRGKTVAWSIDEADATGHSVTDASGMGLFDSGVRAPGGSFTHTFIAAGTYPIIDTVTGTMSKAAVPLRAHVARGDNSLIVVKWARKRAPAGFVHDVQWRIPGSAIWRGLDHTAAKANTYEAEEGSGAHQFRARLRKIGTGTHSGWSPAASVSTN